MSSLFIQNGIIIRAEGEEKANILIKNGVIEEIGATSIPSDSIEVIDATGLLIFPGLIDCHVHFREPGLTHKETMATGMESARAGGVTTVCEMPNTIPPTVTVDALKEKVRLAAKKDIRFFFGVTELRHLDELKKLFTDSALVSLRQRCAGVKLYLDHSTGNQKAEQNVVEAAFRTCAELNIIVVAHCEDSDVNARALAKNKRTDISVHSFNRPPESEAKSIEYAIGLAKKYGTKFHVAHLSTKQGVELVRAAKKSKLSVTCEVAPHHLFLTVDDYAVLGTLAKMNPPLRTREHQEALWEGIADGTVDCISTDHAPHTLEEKNSDEPLKAPSGVPGVETMLPLLLSAASEHWPRPHSPITIPYSLIVRLCFENPNHIFNLGKQGIVEGASADLVLIDPKAGWTIQGKKLHSKCRWSPYEGWAVTGVVKNVITY